MSLAKRLPNMQSSKDYQPFWRQWKLQQITQLLCEMLLISRGERIKKKRDQSDAIGNTARVKEGD
jgi:hypothetical protein